MLFEKKHQCIWDIADIAGDCFSDKHPNFPKISWIFRSISGNGRRQLFVHWLAFIDRELVIFSAKLDIPLSGIPLKYFPP